VSVVALLGLSPSGAAAWWAASGDRAGPTSAAAAGPVIGPERAIADLVGGQAQGTPRNPAVAFDGTNYLVVWEDDRFGYDVFGARVTPTGTVLDPSGIPIATGPDRQMRPAVSFGGGTFFVVWDTTHGDVYEDRQIDVVGARIDPSGAVLEPAPIPVTTAPDTQTRPVVAFGAGLFLVLWEDRPVGSLRSVVTGTRVDLQGSVLDPLGLVLSTVPGNRFEPAVAYGAGSFLVVWRDARFSPVDTDIFGTRVDPAGSVLDPRGIPVSMSPRAQRAPAVSFNGTNHLVVWADTRSTIPRVFGARVSPAAEVLDLDGIEIAPSGGGQRGNPAVVAQGTTYLVAWHGWDAYGGPMDLLGARVDAGGAALDPAGFTIASGQWREVPWRPALGSDGTDALTVWEDRADHFRLLASAVTHEGVVPGPATVVNTAANEQHTSTVAFDGTNHLVVWHDSRPGSEGVYAARVGPGGERLDGAGILIGVGGSPEVSFDGENFLVAWHGSTGVTAVRVSRSGEVLDEPIAIPDSYDGQVALGFDGSNHLVSYVRESRLVAVRVSPGGALLDPTPIPLSGAFGVSRPAIASDGQGSLVVFCDQGEIRGTRVGSDGVVVGTPGFDISIGPDWSDQAAIAWNGQRYLVAWTTARNDGSTDLFAGRVTAAGVVQDPAGITLSTGPGSPTEPVVAANGPFLVAWRATDDEGERDVIGTRVGVDGRVLDMPSVTLAGSGTAEFRPALTRGSGSTWTMTYTRAAAEAPFGANRVFLRTIAPK
jgi:hypothetical protein